NVPECIPSPHLTYRNIYTCPDRQNAQDSVALVNNGVIRRATPWSSPTAPSVRSTTSEICLPSAGVDSQFRVSTERSGVKEAVLSTAPSEGTKARSHILLRGSSSGLTYSRPHGPTVLI